MPKMPLPPAETMELDSLAEVARGGMGSVELARVVSGRLAGQILAVKRLHPNIAEDPEFVSMFLDEAWMTAALKHNNVAQVMAWGNDDRGMFLAIELVQGVSLSRLLKEAQQNQEAFAERTVAFICSQMCGGLVAAHTLTTPDGTPLSLVHRDLTPANVLVSFDGVVKIIDFGIAKAEERISHTRTGQLKGKPAYMAPEQQRGGLVDARADLFAFGVLMFEMLAGRRPWTSKGAFDVMMEISNDPHPDLGELRKGLNPEFVTIAHKCLEKKPDDRIQTAVEIKARLDAWLSAKGFSSDDQHSLAQFILRNSQPQVLWWQEALRGEHSKKKKPTFKELEEKIDEERERKVRGARKGGTPPPRPAAGFHAVNKAPSRMSGTVPMQAYRPDPLQAAGPPDSAPVPSALPPSSGDPRRASMMGVGPSSLSNPFAQGSPSGSGQYAAVAQPPAPTQDEAAQPPAFGASTTYLPSSPLAPSPAVPGGSFGSGQYARVAEGGPRPYTPAGTELIHQSSAALPAPGGSQLGSGQYASVSAPRHPDGGALPPVGASTEYMAISPFAPQGPTSQHPGQEAGFGPQAPGREPGSRPSFPSPAVPPSSGSPGRGAPSHSVVGPAPTLENTVVHESATIPMSPGLVLANTTQPMPPDAVPLGAMGLMPRTRSKPPPPPPRRRSRTPLVVMIVVLLLGGGGAGLWFFGDRIGIDLGALVDRPHGGPAKNR